MLGKVGGVFPVLEVWRSEHSNDINGSIGDNHDPFLRRRMPDNVRIPEVGDVAVSQHRVTFVCLEGVAIIPTV